MRTKNMINALPIVASALGKKHGIKVAIRSDIDTAATDGKMIYLPVLPDTDEALVLARGYIDHESAHIRYTNFTLGMGKGLRKALVNIMEDIRIEQLLGRELPGCRINLEALEKAFVDGNVYTPVTEKSHPANILTARIHHCLRVEVLDNQCTSELAANAKRVFTKVFPPAMVQKVDELLEEAASLRDTAHVCDLSDRILKAIQEAQPQQPEDDQDPKDDRGQEGQPSEEDSSDADDEDQNGQGGNSGSPDEGEDSEGNGSNAGDEDTDSDDQSNESDQGNGSDAGDQGGEGKGTDSEGKGGNAGDEDDDSEDETSESDQGNGSDAGDQGDEGKGTDSEGKGGNAGDVDDDSEAESNESDQGEGSEGADGGTCEDQEQNRQALLQSMDDEVEGSDLGDKVSKILGDLNYAAKMNGQNSGTFPMVLDPIRGSYIDPSEAARETNALRTRLNGMVQASKLKRSPPRRVGSRIDTRSLHKLRTLDTRVFKSSEMKVGVNTAALLLVDQSSSMSDSGSNRHREATKTSIALAMALNGIPGVKLSIAGFSSVLDEDRRLYTPVVRPMKLFNQRIDKTAFVPVAKGGTPIAEALWWAASEVLGLKQVERRMVFILTDGQPDDAKRVKDIVAQMTSAGIECKAIGIGLSISSDLFPSNCSIANVSELPTKVFEMLQELLVAKP